jgi:ribosomal protein S18
MQFNDTTNNKGIVQDVHFLTRTTSADYPLTQITRNVNQHYHDVSQTIWNTQIGWQYDDSNKSDLPIATTNLVNDQQDYELPSTCQRVERIEVLDSASNWSKLKRLDQSDIATALGEFQETNNVPLYYDLIGRSIFLYPTPASASVTTTNGLKVYFNRDVDEFATTATTAAPGFATQFHRILSYGAAIDYERDPNRLNVFISERDRLMDGLRKFYGRREQEGKPNIRPYNRKRHRQYI